MYAVPIVAPGRDVVVTDSGVPPAAEIANVNDFPVEFWMESVTVTAKLAGFGVGTCVGVPEMLPLGLNVNPAGNPWPPDQVYGPMPPLAARG